jgi:hypothetical protein
LIFAIKPDAAAPAVEAGLLKAGWRVTFFHPLVRSAVYRGTTRLLWRKRSPLLHGFVRVGEGEEQHTVAGPGQLQELSERNVDRVIVLNYRLAGPIPYRGEELTVLAGLYSVPREDTAAALISTVGTLAGLVGGPTAVAATDVAKIVKTGVDSILGLAATELKLGVNDTFSTGNPSSSGFLVGIAAPASSVSVNKLWIEDGHLLEGNSRALADPYQACDYFVVNIERLLRRPDWPGLPGLGQYEGRFKTVLSSGKDKTALYAELAPIWPEFREALVNSPHLTRHDAAEIAEDVQADLKKRIEKIASNNPFEPRSFDGGPTQQLDPRDVDFAAVPERSPQRQPAGEQPFASVD